MFLLEHDDVKAVGELLNIAWAVHEMTGEHAGKVINFLTSDPHETYPGATIPKFINNSTNYKKLGEGFDVPEHNVKNGDPMDPSSIERKLFFVGDAEVVDGSVEIVSEEREL